MKLRIGLYMINGLECALCGSFGLYESRDPCRIPGLIILRPKYETCPICGNKTSKDVWSHRYKCLWTRKYKQVLGEARKEMIVLR